MNRFSFKAWDKGKKEWIHEEPCHLIGENILMGGWLDTISIERLNEVVIMQSTGLTDKNGKEIFESDIVQTVADCGARLSVFIVEWHEATASFRKAREDGTYHMLDWLSEKEKEIIGNIYENPELLEQQ